MKEGAVLPRFLRRLKISPRDGVQSCFTQNSIMFFAVRAALGAGCLSGA
eukprot:CAMPEP_0179211710 /NCGR_PEP_ID=MMETSP0797-20121207/638_1 /TAXON_ID=47934 /ORGANISM="Dinophysis acuminata, Strain DAEP01" /LENGTH=48 /DNA_ID= /DNA_START= /DNA_END= /DNA_ORIENTATION=